MELSTKSKNCLYTHSINLKKVLYFILETLLETKMSENREKKCPICLGTGDDPDGCGCVCTTEEEKAQCQQSGCHFCSCMGCGGSCCYCGGTGKEKDYIEGCPYTRRILSTKKAEN